MAEYIDRDIAIRTAIKSCVEVVGHGITQFDAMDIVDAFENIPTADVVEVVRCKDCIFYQANSCFNRQWDFESSTEIPLVRENDYCSYGERRK